jgi:hypothetical protein
MPVPRSVTRIDRDGVQFTSSVLRANYTLNELTRAALRDIGKLIDRRTRDKIRLIANRSLRRARRPRNSNQHWNRKRETDLLVGIRHDTWYGVDQELGLNGQQKRGILRETVFENIDLIIEIQSKYLKHIEDERKALSMIDENAEVAEDDQDA